MTLLIILLVVLGGFLDGLELSQTGAYRAHEGNVLVFDDDARAPAPAVPGRHRRRRGAGRPALGRRRRDSLDATFTVAGVPAVSPESDGGAPAPEDPELEDIALFGYELATVGLPDAAGPRPGHRRRAADAGSPGSRSATCIEIGPTAEPITVAAIVDDLTTGAPTVWVGVEEWRRLVALGNPAAVPPDGTAQILVVEPAGDARGRPSPPSWTRRSVMPRPTARVSTR